MIYKYITISVFIFSILFDSICFANQDSTNIPNLDKVIINAKITKSNLTQIISADDIKKTHTVKTVDALLTNIAGIDVQRSSAGGNKGRNSVKIRGFGDKRTLICINGRSLNGAGVMGGEYVDWSSLSTEDVEKVEIIRGSQNAEYGNAIGGVINIITKKNIKEPRTVISGSFGITPPANNKVFDNNTLNMRFSHQKNIRDIIDFSVFTDYWGNEGFLRNNYVKRNTFGGCVNMYLPFDIKLGTSLKYSIHNRGFAIKNNPASIFYDQNLPISDGDAGGGPGIKWKGGNYTFGDRSYWHNTRKQFNFDIEKKQNNLLFLANLYFNDQDRTEYYYAISDSNHLVLERFAKPEDMTGGWSFKLRHDIDNLVHFDYGIEGLRLRYSGTIVKGIDSLYFSRLPTFSPTNDPFKAIERYSAFIQSSWTLLYEKININTGFRYDRFIGNKDTASKTKESKFNGYSPNMGINLNLWKNGYINFSLSMISRFPVCPELYWYYNGYQPEKDGIARKDLAPERAKQFECGLVQSVADKFKCGIRGYAYQVNDYLSWIMGYKPSRVIYNIDRVNLYGVELETSVNFLTYFNLWGNYTFQTTRKEGDILDKSNTLTNKITEIPDHKANIGLKFKASNDAQCELVTRMVGKKEFITGNLAKNGSQKLEHTNAFATISIFGIYPLVKQKDVDANITIGIENLFDIKYEELYGFPMAGISATLGLNISF